MKNECISWFDSTYMIISFWKFVLPTRLLEPTRLFVFERISYLHVYLILEIFPTYTLLATARLLER